MSHSNPKRPNVSSAHHFQLNPLAACVRMVLAGTMVMSYASPVMAAGNLPVPSAVWASMGSATASVSGSHMQINQHSDRAILNWQSFNIAKDHSVEFKQPGSQSIALNKIFQNDPSRILGKLSANGQVYLVNSNGFVFGKDAKVDVRGMVASSLDISDEVFDQGITKVFSNNGSAALNGSGEIYQKNADGSYKTDAAGNKVKTEIVIEQGAEIKTKQDGQNILIIAPSITNNGKIQADDRQVVLAAATDKVYLQEAGNDGLLVEVKTGGQINNLGSIVSKRGNVNLVGFAINQNGKVSASTSLNVNGKIRLLAREGATSFQTADGYAMQAGSTVRASDNGDGLGTSATVKLGDKSRTEILPELGDTRTAIDEQVQPQSQVDIMGHKIQFQGGSKVTVPGGKVNVIATENPANPLQASTNRNNSRILVESNAKIDVSGLDTAVRSMESNVVQVELRLNQLKDAPLQRDGVLFGQTISVDLRKGTPLTDIQPNIDAIERSLGERLAKGGEINLSSEGDTLIKQNATLDFSGGAVKYLGGYINTTKLIADGRLIDISEAHPSLHYDGIFGRVTQTSQKWGTEQVWEIESPFAMARKEAGYIEGHDAGKLSIKSPNVLIDGNLQGGTVNGRLQRTLAERPKGGVLSIDMQSAANADQSVVIGGKLNTRAVDVDLNQPFPITGDNQPIHLNLKSGIFSKNGIRDVSVLAHGTVTIAKDSKLQLTDGGSLTLKGGAITIAGEIKGTAAQVNLSTDLNAKTQGKLSGDITISKEAKIDLQGGWVNDQATPFEQIDRYPITIDGGRFSAKANGNVDFQKGSSIDVSAGAWLKNNGEVTAGSAGSVEMRAMDDTTGSNIILDGNLSAFALRHGGKLVLEANAVAIRRRREEEPDGLKPLQIEADFFGKGGFADYEITANINGLLVDEGAIINLTQVNRVLDGNAITHGNAGSIASFSAITTLPADQRLPSSLSLRSVHSINPNPNSDLVFSSKASINADALSSVSLISDSSLYFNGAIQARSGNVNLEIIPPQGLPTLDPLYQPKQAIWLDDNARIDVSGIAITTPGALGLKTGIVYDGGHVSITAARGFVATKAGSQINVAGTAAQLNLPHIGVDGVNASYRQTTIGSHGGNIEVAAAEGVFLDGQMYAEGGNAQGTSGGSLTVKLDNTLRVVPVEEGIVFNFPTTPAVINFSQQQISFFNTQFYKAGDSLPVALQRDGYVAAQQVKDAGFAKLSLQADDEIRLLGDIHLDLQQSLKLDAPKLAWQRLGISDSGIVELNVAHAQIGSSRTRNPIGNPGNGAGKLVVNADLVELYGGVYTDGFKQVDLNADRDIRLRGVQTLLTQRDYLGGFATYANLNLRADLIYPTTLSQFNLTVAGDPNGKISFAGGKQRGAVLSALSVLTIKASNIEQNGTVLAPFGEIVFDAADTLKFGANSLTSVSAKGQIIPFGITEGGLEWLYPIGNQNLIVKSPQKNITIKADKILRDAGATIDLSGGGDLQAYEFIPGIGGSVDVLSTNQSFAVLPGYTGYAPFDPLETPVSGLAIGDSIYLGAGSGLAAGIYTMLPAHYALLNGAYLITPQTDSRNTIPGSLSVNIDGASVVSGYKTQLGTSIKEQFWSGFAVEPGKIALTRSELKLSRANSFFKQQAEKNQTPVPRLARDAGSLIFDAKTQLDLPTVRAEAAAGGLSGFVDVVADNIAVVNTKTGVAGLVELNISDLDAFEIGSLLLGGVRSIDSNSGAIKLDVKSKSVTLAENSHLLGPEVILAAKEKVELKAGAQVIAQGHSADAELAPVLAVTGDGAVLRVSNGEQAQIQRTGSQGLTGDLIINNNAKIAAETGSVLLDSNRQLDLRGLLEAANSLNIGAEAINLGEVNSGLNGLSISNAQLAQWHVNELVLTSRSNVNIYGSVPLIETQTQLNHLLIHAPGLAGFANAGKSAAISAGTITLMNQSVVNTNLKGNGSGTLVLNAEMLELAGGDLSISGYNDIQLNIKQAFTAEIDSKLNAFGNLSINTGYVTGKTGSKLSLDASGYALALLNNGTFISPEHADVAAQLNLTANSINIDTPLLFKSGSVFANAKNGDITLKEHALIDVSGAVVRAGLSESVQLAAGRIAFTAQQGNVSSAVGSRMLLNGSTTNMAAGSLGITAANGQVSLNGLLNAQGGSPQLGGSVSIDTGRLENTDFSDMNRRLAEAGFSKAIDFKLRNGDLSVEEQDKVSARFIKLTADKGNLTVAGILDATSQAGGSIELNAYDTLTLTAGARLNANALGALGDGGKVKLSAVNEGGIDFRTGALINVSANGGQAGEVHLRANRMGHDVNISPIAKDSILGDANVVVEAVAHYNLTRLDSTAINSMQTDTTDFMNAADTVSTFSHKFGAGYELAPGVEVNSTDNLTLAAAWDLVDWRYGSGKTPGFLTLRAGRDLQLQNKLSDAFKDDVITVTPTFTRAVTDMLQNGRSWSFNLVAGADIHSADTHSVITDTGLGYGDIRLANDVKVRTGTGDISFTASRDIVYGNDKSVVYTAGRPDEVDRFGLPITRVASNFYVEYPLDGGDISFLAGRNIRGAVTNQIVSDWLFKTGNWSRNLTHSKERPTAWGIALGTRTGSGVVADYRQNVGALGGGDITISAVNTISDLSVVIPTTGKQVGQRVEPNNPNNQDYLTNEIEINGGGNLNLSAGGDIKGGMYYVDGGTATLNTAGSVTAGSFKTAIVTEMNPILALGDAAFAITAGKDIAIQAIIDPMILPQPANKKPDLASIFFRYSADSEVSLTALSGNISLGNNVSRVVDAINNQRATPISFEGAARDSILVAPASLKAYALDGDIALNDSLIMFPSPSGQLELFAANNILSTAKGNNINITMSDTNPNLLPSIANPAANYTDTSLRMVLSGISNEPDKIYAPIPNHINDLKPVLISTATGDILGRDPLQFILPKQTQVMAGNDIRNVSLQIQHNSEDAESIVSAGRDFKFDIVRSAVTGALVNVVQRIEVSGPGRLSVLAGRNVDLGSSEGITTTGNQVNTALAENGAHIDVLAGLAQTNLAVANFISGYLANREELAQEYAEDVSQYMQSMVGDATLTGEAALLAFKQLSSTEQSHFNASYFAKIITMFNAKLQKQGSLFSIAKSHFDNTTDQNTRFKFKQDMDKAQFEVLAAIETLFPGSTVLAGQQDYNVDPVKGIIFKAGQDASSLLSRAYAGNNREQTKLSTGDIAMFFSKIHSTDGGDINLLTPNGGVNAGLAVNSSGAKNASQLGIVAVKQGAIHSLVRDDFQVNTTRVMTLGGGDIMIGATDGNIDAGRGAKTALAAPAPIVRFDSKGNMIVELPPAVAGSGIRANAAPDGEQGDALLFALLGIIDASEAGLGGKSVTVGATAIVGSDNIDAGGVSVGVPVASTGSIAAGLSNVSNVAASVTQAINDSTDVSKSTNEQLASAAALGIINVDILGFGEEEN